MYSVSAVPIKPVLVHIEGIPNDRYAATVENLMGMLMSDGWPKRTNDIVWRKALSSCMSAITTQSDGARARKAFIEAAHEARIHVLPDDEIKPLAAKRTPRRHIHHPTGATPPRH